MKSKIIASKEVLAINNDYGRKKANTIGNKKVGASTRKATRSKKDDVVIRVSQTHLPKINADWLLAREQMQDNILLSDMEGIFRHCLEIATKKNHDYAGKNAATEDPFKNIRNSGIVGVSPQKAILVRMLDKMSRVGNLLDQDAAVSESIEDSLKDIINYSAILISSLTHDVR